MVTYLVQVATGGQIGSASSDLISIALVGVNGESPKQLLGDTFPAGSVQQYNINTPADLGQILFVRLYKELGVPKDNPWKCNYVNVTSPSGESTRFPCYMWLSGLMTMEVQEGKGILLTHGVNPLIVQQRKIELDRNREIYRWKVYADGAPYCIDASDAKELPPDARFSFQKYASFSFTLAATGLEIQLKGFTDCTDPWTDLNDINKVFLYKKTHNSVLVSQMWKEDSFFGYEFLNGVNPVIIRKCIKIPGNFPVEQEMVAAILGTSTDLNKELELGQTPGPNNPIFLSSDPEWDWTLAKIWVRNSDFQVHEIGTHLLRTHLLAEVFNIATARQLPMGHPLYKLIVPHLRYTLEINVLARIQLIGPGGLFDEAFVTGNGGVPVLLKKAMDELTYTCLCLPDDIKERGMESVPNYYYREDGMKVWLAVESLVSGIVNYYYKDDDMVSKDPELQAWVEEIFTKGFLGCTSTGVPSSLGTRAELIKYLTMVIFTCSGQHAAVNSGQFDFFSWLPNGPSSMRKPPPPVKGAATYQTLLDALPEVNTTTNAMAVEWLLSHEPEDKRPLGNFQNERFTEETPQAIIKEFQENLEGISKQIQERNSTIQGLTYLYLDPKNIESSVSI
ncbi:hydroperoxide isomerase ALOXE3-like [Pelobates cultripes]|uniref:Hydroperoxide isomerase ALOXE3-like n=1 Tax=Pelobates cultripes TaxID=61616 RepID=A0AAD1S4P1_PELCU|nr:hydroperoxide isomerase ALOXE3-like [Pelobates cultripes]